MEVSNLSLFFPPGDSVVALPSSNKPRLFIPDETPVKRWIKSGLYPATRWQAKIYRSMLRVKSAIGLGKIKLREASDWPLMEFVEDKITDLKTVVVLVGTPGLFQKITVQLWDSKDQIVGYLKYGETVGSQQKIKTEFKILSKLPSGLGPTPLKYGQLGNGKALLITPVFGKTLDAKLPPPVSLYHVLGQMNHLESYFIGEHPWISELRKNDMTNIDQWLNSLSGKKWPLTIQHGDVAPWNILQSPKGLKLIDWEYGELAGFPYIDLTHYILQVAGLVLRLKPYEAFEHTKSVLLNGPFSVNVQQAGDLIRLAALSAYLKEPQDEKSKINRHQLWRREIWSIRR